MKRHSNIIWLVLALVIVAVSGLDSESPSDDASLVTIQDWQPSNVSPPEHIKEALRRARSVVAVPTIHLNEATVSRTTEPIYDTKHLELDGVKIALYADVELTKLGLRQYAPDFPDSSEIWGTDGGPIVIRASLDDGHYQVVRVSGRELSFGDDLLLKPGDSRQKAMAVKNRLLFSEAGPQVEIFLQNDQVGSIAIHAPGFQHLHHPTVGLKCRNRESTSADPRSLVIIDRRSCYEEDPGQR
ncbi:MAG: hypothetical protein WC184_13305 [Acidimicrobiia bacterium]